jgi:FRG domain
MSAPFVRLRQVPEFIARFFGWAALAGRVVNNTPRIPFVSYRGHAREDWKLLPNLCRERVSPPTEFLIDLLKQDESDVVGEFRSRFGLSGWTDMEVLVYAQHHGAPTRLLDWSRNPLVGLWFTVSDARYDGHAGVVYQLSLLSKPTLVTAMTEPPTKFIAGTDFQSEGRQPVRVFSSPLRVERAQRQASVFSLANFDGSHAATPLEDVLQSDTSQPLRKLVVPAEIKTELRYLLSDLGLDAYSMYGGPDALGKSMMIRLHKPTSGETHA